MLRPADGTAPSFTSYWILFGFFILFTPLAVWVTFAVKLVTDKKQLPAQWRQWPKWEMLAGTIAYIAWAAALPDTPFTVFPWYSSALAGVLVLVTSTLLVMVTPLLQQQLQKTDAIP